MIICDGVNNVVIGFIKMFSHVQFNGLDYKRDVYDNFDDAEQLFHWQTSDDNDDLDESRSLKVGWQS